MNPNIIGIKGRFNLEAAEPFHDSKTTQEEAHHKAKKGFLTSLYSQVLVVSDMYKAVNSTIGLTLVFSIPIISKKKLEQVICCLHDVLIARLLNLFLIIFQKDHYLPNLLYKKDMLKLKLITKTKSKKLFISSLMNTNRHFYLKLRWVHLEQKETYKPKMQMMKKRFSRIEDLIQY